ncbi:MAG TPA: DUF6285 domain-containing protein [Casimicrobiaceae bacterium]|jgi:hypothetical protein
MKDRPSAHDLLVTARGALIDELLPRLPAEAHYAARMVAHAMGIAAREMAASPLDEALVSELTALAGSEPDSTLTPTLFRQRDRESFIARVLADRIRSGAFDRDADARARLHRALTTWTHARLAIVDPRAVEPGR